MAKRSTERFPNAPSPHEPGNTSGKQSDSKNVGVIEHHDKEGRDLAKWGEDNGKRLVKKKEK
jgi:hypothetical protein